jgi:hypothetical protein
MFPMEIKLTKLKRRPRRLDFVIPEGSDFIPQANLSPGTYYFQDKYGDYWKLSIRLVF